jgi:arylsulfatase A-like enzyme
MSGANASAIARSHQILITRRDVLKTTVFGPLAAATGYVFGQARSEPPNIVYMMADDLGYADVACYGRPDLKTPNIDRIAAKGVRLLQGYANSAVCTATRTALITGRYQYRLRLGLEEPLGGGNLAVGLPPEHPTLPSQLKKAGYSTTLIGKWHLGFLPKYSPLKSGYDHFYGFRSGGIDYYRHEGGDHKPDFWDDDTPIDQAGYTTELFGNHAVEVIQRYAKARQRFFLSLHFNAPHWPWEAPGDQAESERLKTRNLAAYDSGTQKTYQRMIETMDTQIGRVLKALDDNRLTNNTIVIFTSDNGGERFADTWPFTGRKTELLEGGLRIPSIISWPARLPQGKTSDQVSISMDWMPTLLAAGGGEPDSAYPMDGINLLPMLTGATPIQPRTLFWRYKANAQRAVRDGDMKFLKILNNTFLFNVAEDPMERANLKDRQKDVYESLVNKWLDWNETMMPEVDESGTSGITGALQSDHIGSPPATRNADNPPPRQHK